MENLVPLLLSFLCLSLCILKLYLSCNAKNKLNNRLPPGPKPWPILGNILQLTNKPHHSLANFSTIHGPLMSFNLGSVKTVVVSSADVARDMFTKHDLAMSDRHVPDATRALNHNLHSMAWFPVSPKWRDLRKLAAIQLFTTKRLDSSQQLRHKKVFELLEHVGECCRIGQAVDIGRVGFTATLNLLSNTIFSTDMAGYNSSSSREFKDLIWGIMECTGKPNLVDFFLGLSYFDPSGIRRELTTHFSKLFAVFDDLIGRKMSADLAGSCVEEDVLDTLLRISKEDGSDLSLDDIKHLLLPSSPLFRGPQSEISQADSRSPSLFLSLNRNSPKPASSCSPIVFHRNRPN